MDSTRSVNAQYATRLLVDEDENDGQRGVLPVADVAVARAIDKAGIRFFAKVRLSCLHLRCELTPSLYALVIRHFEVLPFHVFDFANAPKMRYR
jgi:hypothetical protein